MRQGQSDMSPHDQLTQLLAPHLITAIERLIDDRVQAALAEHTTTTNTPEWLTLEQAAQLLDCTPDAVRMRAKRGRLQTRHHGRRLYVSRRSVTELGATR
jgi:hypothetical protein